MEVVEKLRKRLRDGCKTVVCGVAGRVFAPGLALLTDKLCPRNTANAAFSARGFHLLRQHFYLPLPDSDDLTQEFMESRSELVGLDMDKTAMWNLVEQELAPYFAEFAEFPEHAPNPGYQGFYLINGGYMAVDGHLYYGLVRHLKPRRIVETGCGMSSLLCSTALARNEAEGAARAPTPVSNPSPSHI